MTSTERQHDLRGDVPQVGSSATGSRPAARPFLRIRGVTKRFGALLANDDVSFDVAPGEVVALLGENGAGKSTAMSVLCGLYRPDAGAVELDGMTLELGSPRASARAGIGMVHQQFKLVEALTAFENLSLALDTGRLLQPRAASARLLALMEELGFDLDLARPVYDLPLSARQQLEILRVLAVGARLLILDEPTSVLSPLETEQLFAIVRRIAASGRSVIFISHKIAEIRRVADRIVVMRAGRVVFDGVGAGRSADDIAALIVGSRGHRNAERPAATKGPVRLALHEVSVHGANGRPLVAGASFEVAAGELVALVGVAGNGQIELMDAIGGLRRPDAGTIDAPRSGSRRGFAFIPAQHLGTALAPGLPLEDNAVLGHQRRAPFGWWMTPVRRREEAARVLAAFGVVAGGGTATRTLSGGNLQRVVLGRELKDDPELIVASYPTRGLDIASAAQIRNALIARAAAGAAVLMACEELEESLEIATRILVMSGGRIVADRPAAELDLAELGRLITASGETA
jgi:simple sugar transport system ATP-binding protein